MMTRTTRLIVSTTAVAAAAVLASGCGAYGASGVRFKNADPVWKVNDRNNIAKPEDPGFPKILYYFDRFVFRRTTRLMEIPEAERAANVNALDEVPDSTWFTNRIHLRGLTPEQVRRGPNVDDGPSRDGKWIIRGTKIGGSSVGLIMKDSRDITYILKFDENGIPEMETAANVIVQRLMWAAGYNVPEDNIVIFERDQLELARDAKVSDTFGNKRQMTEKDLEDALARVNVNPDGSYRGMASKFLQGVPVGGVDPEGTRDDDPNDVVDHEERRELRGSYVIFSWVDNTDVKYDNMLDMWVEDPEDPNVHYVMHYLVDFGKALGAMGWIERRPGDVFAYVIDFEYMLYSTFTLGLWQRPWEGADGPPLRGVAKLEGDRFEADNWRPQYPWEPYHRRDRFDGYWGAKIVAAFTDEHIRAAVDAGQYSDPRSAEYIAETLIARRRKIAQHWFREVTPLDHFTIDAEGALCFDDLSVVYGTEWTSHLTTYSAEAFDYDGNRLNWTTRVEQGNARDRTACVSGFPTGTAHDGYTIVKIVTHRPEVPQRPVEAHLATGEDGALRIVGVHRH
jgi:hypothetical protein